MDNFVTMNDLARGEVDDLFETAETLKNGSEAFSDKLENDSLLMLFEKPSTRTRISFESGMTELGGHAIYFYKEHAQLSRGEALKDTARVFGGYCDGVMARLFDHSDMRTLANYAGVPVINGLTERAHPCQALSDMFTLWYKGISLDEMKLAYLGEGNNVSHSLMRACALVGADIVVATPESYGPDPEVREDASRIAASTEGSVSVVNSPEEAVANADVVYTDVWVSMGEERSVDRIDAHKPFQVSEELLSAAGDVLFMHCLPAHRGEEVTQQVLEGDRSIVFDQAENRKYVQQALLLSLLG